VNDWEPWNEPNIPGSFSAPNPVNAYRVLLARSYAVLKSVHQDNLVVLGGLAPVSPIPGSTPPLDFGAQLLCLRRSESSFRPNHSCRSPARFDIFAIHPYSLDATPTEPASKPGDVLVADMGKVAELVHTADRLHTVPGGPHKIWVTEWGWFTNPPDAQYGDPPTVAARYVAGSMYEMWRSGVSLVIWLDVRDSPTEYLKGGGLYTTSGIPKPTLRAFAFPFVASVSGGSGLAWGRVPVSGVTAVRIQRQAGSRWSTVAVVQSSGAGIFTARFRSRGRGRYRALADGRLSLAYDSTPIPPRHTHTVRVS
jgi:hypothetical protein